MRSWRGLGETRRKGPGLRKEGPGPFAFPGFYPDLMTTWVPLVDVSDLTLAELVDDESGPVRAATRRIIGELKEQDTYVSGFQSAVE